jgi:predicted Zn finger-like uncharacterized protein
VFTQCSKCETVFRLSAEALRAAGGQVRCGRCGEVFNALSRLAEDATGFIRGESPLYLESRAEEILESSASDLEELPLEGESSGKIESSGETQDLDLPPGVEHAQLHFIGIVDDDLAAETSLEFTLPPGELDRIFIETGTHPLDQLTADVERANRSESLPPHPEALRLLVDGRPEPAIVPTPAKVLPTPTPLETVPPKVPVTPPRITVTPPKITVTPPTVAPTPPKSAPAPAKVASPQSRIAGLEVSEDVRQEMLSGLKVTGTASSDAARRQSSPASSPRRLAFGAWLAMAVLLAALLAFQLVRANPDWVAVHVPWLGASGPTTANLSVYQLRQWGVTGDPGAKGTLRVRASIMNTAAQLQPYPLLRVMLVNRFGSRIGAREFDPAEYLGRAVARMLAPGERVDATLDILDPGKDAEGFEIDVCLRSGDQKIVCAGDAAANAK